MSSPLPAPVSDPPSPEPLGSRVLAGTSLQVFGRLWSSVCSMGVWMLLGRSLDDAGEGLFAYYFTLFMVAGPVLDFGAFGIAVREIAKHPERELSVLRYATRFRLLMGAVCAVVVAAMGLLREGGVSGALIAMSSVHLLALSPATVGASFQSRLRFGALAVPLMAGSTLFLGLAAVFHATQIDRPEAYLIAYGVGICVQSLGTFAWGMRRFPPFGPINPEHTRGLLREMAPIGISATATALYFQLDAILLRELAGPGAVGQYNHAFRLLTFAIMVPLTFCQALFPILSRAQLTDRSQVVRIMGRATVILAGVILPAAAMAPWLGDAVIAFVFGSASKASTQCLAVLGLAGVAIYLAYPGVTALTAIGRQATFTKIALAVAPVKFLGIWLLFRAFGLVGVACAALLTETLVLGLVSFSIRSYLGSFGFGRALARPLLAALPVGVAAYLIRDLEGIPALLSAIALQIGGVLVAGILPLNLGAQEEQ